MEYLRAKMLVKIIVTVSNIKKRKNTPQNIRINKTSSPKNIA